MIHPDTAIRFVSEEIGLGVFATEPIAKGTLIYVRDPLEIKLSPQQFNRLDVLQKTMIEKYSYIDADGHLIMSWDHAKYMNHSCESNTIGTAYGFEIAIRDIAVGEELTSEYGVLNIQLEYEIGCNCLKCRRILRLSDIDQYHPVWDGWIAAALKETPNVPQPLWSVLDAATLNALGACLSGDERYRSVLCRKWRAENADFEWTFKA